MVTVLVVEKKLLVNCGFSTNHIFNISRLSVIRTHISVSRHFRVEITHPNYKDHDQGMSALLLTHVCPFVITVFLYGTDRAEM